MNKVLKKIDNDKIDIINGLNPIDIVNLYLFVCEYDTNIKAIPGSFDITNKKIDKLTNKYDVFFDTCAVKNLSKASKHDYYILFEQNKNSKASKDDKAHHLMRHIRNAIAHGHISKRTVNKKVEIYEMIDNNGKKDTMWGRISVQVLFQLIEALINSKK